MLGPVVTVLRQDVPALGRKAAELIFARIGGDQSPPTHAVVPATLVQRGSGEFTPPHDQVGAARTPSRTGRDDVLVSRPRPDTGA
ncbi:hypothetical protein ALI22I_10205 [Saccharothrix sp. ALI-22-I]|uniref:substrate-binding domain-containing protein n=1 Tax=Saccharothrix sp. ALI-22-I TaxID=1933778 RepID=UPI00097BA888|nr:substrate-binding domain-containing protein [Saccharothrix sp. ALI-22-I]ONI91125.1 hypothetical protein ALI22I_10205 [Saccharothrix sp. ALI-22-I]